MKKYISLFLAALMLLSLLAGCGNGKTNAGDGDGTRTLVLRNAAGLSTNDPHATTNTHDYTVFENIYEGLYDLNEATGAMTCVWLRRSRPMTMPLSILSL